MTMQNAVEGIVMKKEGLDLTLGSLPCKHMKFMIFWFLIGSIITG